MKKPTNSQILCFIGDMLTEDHGEGDEFVDYMATGDRAVLGYDVRVRGEKMTVVLDHGTSETTLEVSISAKAKVLK